MLETQGIRRHADGSIDYGHYKTEAGRLRGQAMRDQLKPRAAAMMFAAVTTIGIALLAGIAGPHPVGDRVALETSQATHAVSLERVREPGRASARATPMHDANDIRQRIVTLSKSDPQWRWQEYVKSTTRSRDEAIAELQGRIARSRAGHAEALLRSRAWWESFGQRRHGVGIVAAAD